MTPVSFSESASGGAAGSPRALKAFHPFYFFHKQLEYKPVIEGITRYYNIIYSAAIILYYRYCYYDKLVKGNHRIRVRADAHDNDDDVTYHTYRVLVAAFCWIFFYEKLSNHATEHLRMKRRRKPRKAVVDKQLRSFEIVRAPHSNSPRNVWKRFFYFYFFIK